MQKLNNIFLKAAVLLTTAMILAGCLLEKEDASETMQKVMIELSVAADQMTKSASTDIETKINSLRIYAFNEDKLAGYAARGIIAEGEPFYMDLELPASGEYDVFFYVIANEANMAYQNDAVTLSPDMTRSQLEAIRFTGLTSASAIPMYACQKESVNVDQVMAGANSADGHDGHIVLTKKVQLQLSRSLAKISLLAAKADGMAAAPQILNVTLLAGGTRTCSYLFPQEDQVLNEVASRSNDRNLLSSAVTVSESVVPGSSASKDPSNFSLIFSDAYLPEVTYGSSDCSVSSGNSREVVLKVEYSLGEGGEVRRGFVYMPRITRNTHYKVCLVVNSEGRLIINYEVAPWEDNEMNNLHFDYPTHSYLRESIPATEEEIASEPSAPAIMSEAKPFEGYFQMNYPENDAWTPTLEGPMAGKCTVEVYETNGLNETPVPMEQWPIAACEKWFKVVVKPNPMKLEAGDEVRLAITYTASGFDEVEYLLINGSYQEYYWPYEGTSSEDANYIIIEMVN